jgi:hypothetical protein
VILCVVNDVQEFKRIAPYIDICNLEKVYWKYLMTCQLPWLQGQRYLQPGESSHAAPSMVYFKKTHGFFIIRTCCLLIVNNN